jgi:eukaryotic-like serine/threonine-protein kinase
VVYEMLAGEPPHTGPTVQAVIAKLMTERPTRIRTVRDTIPEGIDAAVTKALAKLPVDRYGSAGKFASALEDGMTEGPKDGPPQARRPSVLPSFRRSVLLAVIALAALAAIWHPWRRPTRTAARGSEGASVAVLPFENLSGNAGDQYLSDGMTEEVIGQLARVPGLKVISRNSVEALKGTHLSTRQIADTLGVRHVLEGSVRHAANRIRVAVDLIDAATDGHVWASSYDRDLTDVFAVQEEIARQVADTLVSTVGMRAAVAPVARTGNAGAYEAFLSGRYLMYRRTRDGLRGARVQFEKAIALDSAYAPAYANLALVYFLWDFYAYPGIDFYQAVGRSLAMADRALALDPSLAEAYAARGRGLTFVWGPSGEISADFQRALALRPNSADVHQWYSNFLTREARFDEALAEVERAITLDPLAPGVRAAYSSAALAARRYDLAAREAERGLALEPGLLKLREQEALGDLLAGNAVHCATLGLGPYVGVRAMCLYSLGRAREAGQIADSLRAAYAAGTADDSLASPVIAARGLAEYYAWIGNAGESVAWQDRAFGLSPEGEDLRVMASGLYDKVRGDPRFKASLERIHARIYERAQREKLAARFK